MSRGIRVPGYDTAQVSRDTATQFVGVVSMAQEQFADEVDVNTIVRRFGLTQSLPANLEAGVYGDFSGITDFESAVEMVDRARQGFMGLPAELRDRFKNDPARLIAFAQSLADDEVEEEFGALMEPPAAAVVAAPAAVAAAPGPEA